MTDTTTEQFVLPFSDYSPDASIGLDAPAEEMIGAANRVIIRQTQLSQWFRTVDVSWSDYAWWDKTRRGKTRGFELSGLFLKPLGSKVASWVLGQRPLWQTTSARATTALNDWWRQWHPSILRAFNEAVDLADCYLVLNGDLSMTVVPPHMVSPLVDPNDFSQPIGWKVSMTTPDPNNSSVTQTVEDYFTAKYRRRIIKSMSGSTISDITYPNPTGRIPVIHIANRKGVDEFYGRPEGEALVNALLRYGDVLDAALKGNIRQGRPTPVIEKMGTAAQVQAFWSKFGHMEQRINPETGQQEQVLVIDFDPDVLLTLGADATFRYAAPDPFTTDTINLLQIIFYLVVQFSEVPEFVWGNAIGSSKASAESQLEPFLKWIAKRRGEAMEWMQQLADLVLSYMAVYERKFADLKAVARWRPIASADGRLTLDTTIWAWSKGLITDEYAAWLLPVGIDDPDQVVKEGLAQRKQRPQIAVTGSNVVPSGDVAGGAVPATPASGGGQQGQFKKQEQPLQPTERQQAESDDQALYEQSAEAIIDHNRMDDEQRELMREIVAEIRRRKDKAAA